MAQKKSRNRTKLNLFLDLGLASAFIIVMEEHFTGVRFHEWLGLAITALFMTHILLHWQWIVAITKRFFVKFFHETRLNYVLNLALFIDMLIVIVTGIWISRTLVLHLNANSSISIVHIVASHVSLVIVGLHVGMHWKWIATHSRKYLLHLPARKSATRQSTSALSAGGVE